MSKARMLLDLFDNPLFPALRSGPTAASGATPKKKTPSNTPPASSFRSIGPAIGELALTVLIRHFNGTPLPKGEIDLPSPSVVERSSTGLPAGIDPVISKTVRFIRRNALKDINVDGILAAIPGLSRSRLYRRVRHPNQCVS